MMASAMKSCVFLATAIFAPSAGAQDLKSMTLANELASVLASEDMCGLSYDQAAIAAFVEKRVKPDDLGFASNLKMMTSGQEFQLKNIGASAKTAHCTQIRRVAKSYNFTK